MTSVAATEPARAESSLADVLPLEAKLAHGPIVKIVAPCGESFQRRIGINTGPVVAGVIGKTKFTYDLWGETVATAWEMAALGAPGNIQVNETTEAKLRDQYLFEERGDYYIKDKGTVRISFLKGKRRGPRSTSASGKS